MLLGRRTSQSSNSQDHIEQNLGGYLPLRLRFYAAQSEGICTFETGGAAGRAGQGC